MRIVADENMPFVKEAFDTLGNVRLVPGRKMTSEIVRDAELLLVRSVTPVNAKLLSESRVRFVGTATIGTDHVDTDYLRNAGIAFAVAPGSNANSVAEYIVAALLVVAQHGGNSLAGRSLGVIGVGSVGGRVAAKATALGMRVLLNDPPLQRATRDPKYRPLDELLDCDFLTFHVPLEKAGTDPTWHMADAGFLSRMKKDAVLLNTSRGAVVDNPALLLALKTRRVAGAVLDVWEGEPAISVPLIEHVTLATPHIAGYSFDGKVNGTEMLYRAACNFLGKPTKWSASQNLPEPPVPEIRITTSGRSVKDALREAVGKIYPIERDDIALRKLVILPTEEQGPFFDRLRKEYPMRREFQNTRIRFVGGNSEISTFAKIFCGIGFKVTL